MNKLNRQTTILIAVAVVILAVGAVVWASTQPQPKTPVSGANLDAFAQCLADKNITMYGAAWCSHCQNQKKLFGDSFKYVKYVECPDNTQLCISKGVNGYPTWITAGGEQLVGEQSLEILAQKSGCVLK